MTAMQVIDVVNSGRTFQAADSGSPRASLPFSVMVTPEHTPIKRLVPAMFGCDPCGQAWMITSPSPFGTCRGCGRRFDLIAP